ncbi:unnamed protein product [Kuraishia capsulata CBS 1993]|uniref:Eukaryotic translation initiation factor 3 subunit J n=1 Tax=Kuraishia capsulata CBS 1993 TaxID=1382522 RepID=W6MSN9_9ASCO|nr:uncharacterized protein KUCA_T00005381001 [Kuraishia capsulata CBS 1993]CDK29393.1 unnamed protein product [Kuraishia capsulata CBS 1993]
MSWDDEDFDVKADEATAVSGAWDDDFKDDDDGEILESWDLDSDEEREKKRKQEAEVKAKKQAELEAKKAKEAAKKSGKKKLLEIDLVDEKTRKEMLKDAELNSDLNNAADLFGGLGVADEHPRAAATRKILEAEKSKPKFGKDTPLDAHPIFHPQNKADFEKLRKTLGPILTKLADESSLNYTSSLAIDLIRDLCGPLTVESTRKVVSTINALVTTKAREERQARLSKAGGTATGGAGKKKAKAAAPKTASASFKQDEGHDMTNYDELSDDDFM